MNMNESGVGRTPWFDVYPEEGGTREACDEITDRCRLMFVKIFLRSVQDLRENSAMWQQDAARFLTSQTARHYAQLLGYHEGMPLQMLARNANHDIYMKARQWLTERDSARVDGYREHSDDPDHLFGNTEQAVEKAVVLLRKTDRTLKDVVQRIANAYRVPKCEIERGLRERVSADEIAQRGNQNARASRNH